MAEQGPAGKCLELFVERWFFVDDPHFHAAPGFDRYRYALELAAGTPAGSDGLIFLPWVNGAGPPTGDAFVRGGFLNQSLRTSRAEALRAVLEGVAYNLNWLLAAQEKFINRRYGELKFSGGGTIRFVVPDPGRCFRSPDPSDRRTESRDRPRRGLPGLDRAGAIAPGRSATAGKDQSNVHAPRRKSRRLRSAIWRVRPRLPGKQILVSTLEHIIVRQLSVNRASRVRPRRTSRPPDQSLLTVRHGRTLPPNLGEKRVSNLAEELGLLQPLDEMMHPYREQYPAVNQLPAIGLPREQVLAMMEKLQATEAGRCAKDTPRVRFITATRCTSIS